MPSINKIAVPPAPSSARISTSDWWRRPSALAYVRHDVPLQPVRFEEQDRPDRHSALGVTLQNNRFAAAGQAADVGKNMGGDRPLGRLEQRVARDRNAADVGPDVGKRVARRLLENARILGVGRRDHEWVKRSQIGDQ
jgi:hypothetical protein